MMMKKIESIKAKRVKVVDRVKSRVSNDLATNLDSIPTSDQLTQKIKRYEKVVTDSLQKIGEVKQISSFKRKMKNLRRGIKNDYRLIDNYTNSMNRYLVELHKKFSIPFASIVFILIGAPLGIMDRKGNFALSTSISLGFFIVYWAFLIAGENFADRGIMTPLVSMWLPNIVLSILGLFLIYKTSKDRSKIKFDFLNLFFKKEGKS